MTDFFFFWALIVLLWAWFEPEKLGRWLARVKVGMRRPVNAGGEN